MEDEKKLKVCASVPGNCLVCTNVSIFDNFLLNYVIDLCGKPHKSRSDVSVPVHSTAIILHC